MSEEENGLSGASLIRIGWTDSVAFAAFLAVIVGT